MNHPYRIPLRRALGNLPAVVGLLLLMGCREPAPDAVESPAPESPEPTTLVETEPLAQSDEGGLSPPADTSPSLASMVRRVRREVEREVLEYRQELLRYGLTPGGPIELSICSGQTGVQSPRRQIVARSVAEKLAEELSHITQLDVRLDSQDSEAKHALSLDVETDFNMPFDAIACAFKLRLGERHAFAQRDHFSDFGLVLIDGVEETEQLIVTVRSPELQLDFSASGSQWYMLPRGPYEYISVSRTKGGHWSPRNLTIGSQAIWDVSETPHKATASKLPREAVTLPPPEPPARSVESEPSLSISYPADNAQVPRNITVRGRGRGLDSSGVEVIVYSDLPYVQDGRGWVSPPDDGTWEVGAIIGRSGSVDVGEVFQVRARARRSDGRSIESDPIRVRRE